MLTATAFLFRVMPALAAAAEGGVPLPHGWIGTTAEWIQGFGIGLVALDLILLAVAWRILWRGGVGLAARGWLLVAIVLVPSIVTFFSFAHGLDRSMTVAGCGSCHVMVPFVDDLRNPGSNTLAAIHFKNRYILDDQCYTCHSDYGLAGTLQAKLEGLGHVWRYTRGTYTLPIKMARPYSNLHCLRWHAASQKFVHAPGHPEEQIPNLLAGTASCLDCHGPAHAGRRGAISG